jgi:hypothetical protein
LIQDRAVLSEPKMSFRRNVMSLSRSLWTGGSSAAAEACWAPAHHCASFPAKEGARTRAWTIARAWSYGKPVHPACRINPVPVFSAHDWSAALQNMQKLSFCSFRPLGVPQGSALRAARKPVTVVGSPCCSRVLPACWPASVSSRLALFKEAAPSFRSFLRSRSGRAPLIPMPVLDPETVVYGILAANLGVFCLWQVPAWRRFMAEHFMTSRGHLKAGYWHTLVTHAFSQQAFFHLFSNMFTCATTAEPATEVLLIFGRCFAAGFLSQLPVFLATAQMQRSHCLWTTACLTLSHCTAARVLPWPWPKRGCGVTLLPCRPAQMLVRRSLTS